MRDRSKTTYLFGALDRFNFGDLLFPVLLSRLLGSDGERPFKAVGLRHSDFSSLGGMPTDSMSALLRPGGIEPGSRIILAGGEILTAQAYLMLRYLLPLGLWVPARLLEHTLPRSWLNEISRRLVGAPGELPFVIAPDDFQVPVTIAFNAVGGCTLSSLGHEQGRWLAKKLSQAAYLSVRDHASQRNLRALDPALEVGLAPDTGILAADAFPLAALESRPLFRELREAHPRGYLCFQAARYLVKGEVAKIAAQLLEIRAEHRLGIVLLPLGRAAEHEDQVALQTLQRHLPEARLIAHTHLQDLLAVIAGARIFAGTSLHGNIIAMAYDVPHLGLTHRVPKLQAYLETWASPELSQCISFGELARHAGQALNTDGTARTTAKEHQLREARLNLSRLAARLQPIG